MKLKDVLSLLEDILEGINYTVFLQAYEVQHPLDFDAESIIKKCFPKATIGKMGTADMIAVLREVTLYLFYRGDSSSGPEPEVLDSQEFLSHFEICRQHIETLCRESISIHDFWLRDGHPAYPVFWDFSFIFRGSTHSTILMGSSSD